MPLKNIRLNKHLLRDAYGISLFFVICSGCADTEFKKTKGVVEYKIFYSDNKNKKAIYGNAVRFKRIRYYDDSILTSIYDNLPQLSYLDSARILPEYLEILLNVKQGDSLITRILVDSLIKIQPEIPPYAMKGKYVGFKMKILNVITDKTTAEVLENDAVKQKAKIDSLESVRIALLNDKILKDYLDKKKIHTLRTPEGIYIGYYKKGYGPNGINGQKISLNYTAKTLDGKIFETTYDSLTKKFNPITFNLGDPAILIGLNKGLLNFNKNSKGNIFIPSQFALGNKSIGVLKANECVIYEVEIIKLNE